MAYDPELQKIYYDRNPEAYLKRSRSWYWKNRERVLAAKKRVYRQKKLEGHDGAGK